MKLIKMDFDESVILIIIEFLVGFEISEFFIVAFINVILLVAQLLYERR